ncbi:MAG TPA: hypothetical protein DC042_11795 [Bacteroidales bacterium]|nr:hypothetical protein [Bacteroidales bacterium]
MKNARFTVKPLVTRVLVMTSICLGLIMINTACEDFNPFKTNDYVSMGTEDANIAKAVVGKGYDISSRFAHSESIKESVLDFTLLAGDQKVIKDKNIAQTEVTTKEGNTISEYQMGFDYAQSSKAGVEGLFSAEVGFNFGYDRAKRTDYSYATVSSYTHKYGIYIDGKNSPAQLSNYVSAQFLSDVASMDAATLIGKYGTHAIVGGIWGASLDFSMSAQRKSVSNTYSFGAFVSAEATLEGINLGGSQSISAEFSNYFESSTKKYTINAKGGNSEHALSIITASTPEGRDNAYAAWVQTIDGNPAFCDYYEGGLVPIYEFITDAAAKAKLQTGIENYLDSKGIDIIEVVTKVIDKEFEVKDFCTNVGQGDSNVDADGNGKIYVELTFSIEIDMNNDLALSVNMKVHEMKGDYTKLEGSIDKRLFTNLRINSLEVPQNEFGFNAEITFNPENDAYFPVAILPGFLTGQYKLPGWLSYVLICIDGGTKDDSHVIGVRGRLKVPVTILP